MTNKTEHDGHGSKTVEISDMKYNIFKVWHLLRFFFILFYLLNYLEGRTNPRSNIISR